MKAGELMIGDWVLSLIGTPCRVKIESFVCHDSWLDGNHGAFNFNEVDPAPLTEKVLKENGWEKNDPNWPSILRKFYKKDNHSFTLSCWMQKGKWDMYIHDNGNMELNRFHPSYVHELQHALRLFGLNDLADNFKVE